MKAREFTDLRGLGNGDLLLEDAPHVVLETECQAGEACLLRSQFAGKNVLKGISLIYSA
jgi:hypothetical protein